MVGLGDTLCHPFTGEWDTGVSRPYFLSPFFCVGILLRKTKESPLTTQPRCLEKAFPVTTEILCSLFVSLFERKGPPR